MIITIMDMAYTVLYSMHKGFGKTMRHQHGIGIMVFVMAIRFRIRISILQCLPLMKKRRIYLLVEQLQWYLGAK